MVRHGFKALLLAAALAIFVTASQRGRAAGPATKPAGTSAPTSRAADDRVIHLSSWGIEFTPPAGWTRVDENDLSQLAQLVRIENGKQTGLMVVDLLPGGALDISDMAKAVANDNGLKLTPEKNAPKGTVSFNLAKEVFPNCRGAIFARGLWGVTVRIGTDDLSAADLLAAVLKSMTVTDFQPVVNDLSLRNFRTRLFGSPVSVRLPEAFRLLKKPEKGEDLHYVATDWRNGRDGSAHLFLGQDTLANENAMEFTADTIANSLTAKLKLSTPIKFTPVDDAKIAWLGSAITINNESARTLLVRTGPKQFATLTFDAFSSKADVREKYMAMVEAVAKSVQKDDSTTQPTTRPTLDRMRFRGD